MDTRIIHRLNVKETAGFAQKINGTLISTHNNFLRLHPVLHSVFRSTFFPPAKWRVHEGYFLFILLGFTFFSLVSFTPCMAQHKNTDTTAYYNPYWTKYYSINDPNHEISIDTSLDHLYRYNPAQFPFAYMYLGNLGAAARPLFVTLPEDAGLDIGFH